VTRVPKKANAVTPSVTRVPLKAHAVTPAVTRVFKNVALVTIFFNCYRCIEKEKWKRF